MNRRAWTLILLVLLASLALLLAVVGRPLMAPALPPLDEGAAPPPDPALVARGQALARAGNCQACHTARGGAPYAGGHVVDTPFGRLVAGNLTPDRETGIGTWSREAFRRALHEGIARDGRLLYPAFPYVHTTRLTDEDVDALYAYLRSLPPVRRAVEPHELRFPYGTQLALAVWRALNFEAGRQRLDPARDAEWNRGAYLAEGVAHCAACHSTRNALAGVARPWAGGLTPDGRWYAPSLLDPAEAGVQDWPAERVVALLRDGSVAGATAMGPMAEVVFHGTAHLGDDDLRAIARYLRELPVESVPRPTVRAAETSVMALGSRLYEQHCADCHGAQGQGARGAYPPLAGNRAVRMASPVNVVQAILSGGFAPATAANPRPYGMPPFRTLLSDAEIAAVATYVRQSWGNEAGEVTALEVRRLR